MHMAYFSWASSNFFQFTFCNIPWHYFSCFTYHRSWKNSSQRSSRSGVWSVSMCLHTLNTHMHTGILVFWQNLHTHSAHYLYPLYIYFNTDTHTHTYISLLNIYIWEGEIPSCEADEHGLEDKRCDEQEVQEDSWKAFFLHCRGRRVCDGIQNSFEMWLIIESVETSLDCSLSDEVSRPFKRNNPNRHAGNL